MTLQIYDGWLYIDHLQAVSMSEISHLDGGAFREAIRDDLGSIVGELVNSWSLIASLRVREIDQYGEIPSDPGMDWASHMIGWISNNRHLIVNECEKHLMFGRWT